MKPRISFLTTFGALTLLLIGCGKGSSPAKVATKLTTAQPSVSVQSAGPTTALPADVTDAVDKTVRGYLRFGTMTPLKTGGNATDLATYFNAEALVPVTGADAGTVLDQQLPKATADVNGKISNYEFIGLTDKTGSISMVAVKLDALVTTKNKNGDVTIKRTGDLVVVPDGTNWKIGSYNLSVTRSGSGIPNDSKGSGK